MEPRFDGATFTEKDDQERLAVQHVRIRDLMLDCKWRTLPEIHETLGYPVTSISAQLRHLRKPRFGGFVIEKRHRGPKKWGLYEYRVMPGDYVSETKIKRRKNKIKTALEQVWKLHPECRATIRKVMSNDD